MTAPVVVADRYELRERIGRGGMAEVHRAFDRQLGREVAVKLLHAAHASEAAMVERFKREALTAGSIEHPNIVRVHDSGVADGTHYLVMEHVGGGTLKDAIRREGAFAEDRALDVAAQVAAALEAAHRRGVVHRDLKPQNILV
ncbi:MAG: protein kinase domain-containing protein, partial [Candidatus Limnocylindria bacterium]